MSGTRKSERLSETSVQTIDLPKAMKNATRMDLAAEELLEKVLGRSRWIAKDRDAVSAYLDRLVTSEIRRRGAANG